MASEVRRYVKEALRFVEGPGLIILLARKQRIISPLSTKCMRVAGPCYTTREGHASAFLIFGSKWRISLRRCSYKSLEAPSDVGMA
ncbi:UNVERIFIED_CONTAM: hypothetical protein Sindi_2133100, partial [Sesamum indicum]